MKRVINMWGSHTVVDRSGGEGDLDKGREKREGRRKEEVDRYVEKEWTGVEVKVCGGGMLCCVRRET